MGEFVTVSLLGHKDHGKSTLIGRLLYETKSVTEERVAEARKMSESLGFKMEYAFLLDSFQEEREGGFTLDTTRAQLKHGDTVYELIDVPGHKELVKNMLSGASNAEAAILIVSLKEGEGLQDETRLHASLGRLLGIEKIVVAVNKIDLTGFDEAKFNAFASEIRAFLKAVGFEKEFPIVPVSAINGDNVVAKSAATPWFKGKPLMTEIEERFKKTEGNARELPLRLPVQDAYGSMLVGLVEHGALKKGDKVVFQPGGVKGTVGKIMVYGKELSEARAGQNIGFEVEGIQDAAQLKESVCALAGQEPKPRHRLEAEVFCLNDVPAGRRLVLKCKTGETVCVLGKPWDGRDLRTLEPVNGHGLKRFEEAKAQIILERPLVIEEFSVMPSLGRFVLLDAGTVAGFGKITELN